MSANDFVTAISHRFRRRFTGICGNLPGVFALPPLTFLGGSIGFGEIYPPDFWATFRPLKTRGLRRESGLKTDQAV